MTCVSLSTVPVRLPGIVGGVESGTTVRFPALAAFALSRTVGLFGFSERGWQPSPHAAVSVIAEVLTVALVAASVLSSRSKTAAT